MSITNRNPQLIVLTPVRNEAWVLRAFLTATSLWADKIIIADQMSTDGSREICKEFPKVILLDNDRAEMHQAASRRMLFDAVRSYLNGDTNAVLFALDADEFLYGDFVHTSDWQCIMQSQPDDAFCWRWMNLKDGDLTHYSYYTRHFYWAVHVSETMWNGEFPDNFIHEWRLPWSSASTREKTYDLNELCSIHFANVNVLRQRNKQRFYQVSSLATANSYWNVLNIYRMYHRKTEKCEFLQMPADAYKFYEDYNIDILKLIDFTDEGIFHIDEMKRFFVRDGLEKYAWLDIWDDEWCRRLSLDNPQKWYHRFILSCLKWSGEHRNIVTKAIDKVLKKLL